MKTYRVSAICHKSVEIEAKNLKEATKLGRETLGQPSDWNNVMILDIAPLEQAAINIVATAAEATVQVVAEKVSEPVAVVAEAAVPVAVPAGDAKVQVLTCGKCEKTWERPAQRGRKPVNCPECN